VEVVRVLVAQRADHREGGEVDALDAQARAACEAGCDGVFLDWWDEGEVFEGVSMLPHRTNLLAAIRAAIGPEKLVIVNSNDRQVPISAPWVNGLFMECYDTSTSQRWAQIEGTLVWAEANLRAPRVNCLEFWYHSSRNDSNLMRAATTLALTRSDGYCLFSDPNSLPTGDHLHNWYAFWDRSLGHPLDAGAKMPDGSVRRAFDRGTAVFNTMGNPAATVTFPRLMASLATGVTSRQHTVATADGDIFLAAPFTTNDTPYAWFQTHGISNGFDTADALDPDGDGKPTWQEFRAGTDPLDSNSVFRIVDIQPEPGLNRITWLGSTNGSGKPFVVLSSANPGAGWTSWTSLMKHASGTNTAVEPTGPLPRFYRIEVAD
ncbi:MAG: hypothetical protein KJ579_06890, partial [Verrucomicrobia bacterium]|nr:hypothetical protein [Verrucomicrobiota bacterium]